MSSRSTLTRPDPTHGRSASAVAREEDLDAALAGGGIHSLYQPIVDLVTGQTVAVEALARGPQGPLAAPDALFAAARELGRLVELERSCQEAAVVGARRAGLGVPLFVNVEPLGMEGGDLGPLTRVAAILGGRIPLVIEITERALAARPAELIDFLARARAQGWGIALDDVGVESASLALLPIVRPDIVKLDRGLIQDPPSPRSAAVLTAVAAECERTGATILAEGIETERHRRTAAAAGATLAQGYLFGRPGPLPEQLRGPWRPPLLAELQSVEDGSTPYTVVAPDRPVRRASWRFLLEVSKSLEEHARAADAEAVIVSAFQSRDRFTPLTTARYRVLGGRAAFVAALGVGMPIEPVAGVRGAALGEDDPLRDEWSVVVLGPHFSGALVARELDQPRRRPDFTYAVTYRRDLVVRAATALMRQVARVDRI